jgi:flagellar assembly protein FliH
VAVKIIKNGLSQHSQIHAVSFGNDENLYGAAPAEQPTYAEALFQDTETAQPPTNEPAAPPSPVDVAEIEKNAYENGFRQGEKAGMEMADKKVSALMRSYGDAILELGKQRSRLYAQVERQVVKLALEAAKKIVHREIQADKEIIQTLVKVALSHVAEKSAVTVHLHPIDYSYILDHRSELSGDAEGGREVVLLADKNIQRGGCLVETECGNIDARIEEEFKELERAFFEGAK